MEEKRILVIDDDAANLTMANKILSQANMRVSCVKSGETALKFLQANKPEWTDLPPSPRSGKLIINVR